MRITGTSLLFILYQGQAVVKEPIIHEVLAESYLGDFPGPKEDAVKFDQLVCMQGNM